MEDLKYKAHPKFSITLIGITQDLVFNHWRSELLRIKQYLAKSTRKIWDMNLTSQFCTSYEFEKKHEYLKQQLEIQPSLPIILTENKVYQDLQQFIQKYLKQKLGITEMNQFKQMELKEVLDIIKISVNESISAQLKPNDSRDFGYFKLFDDDTDEIFSFIFQVNKIKCPNMVSIFMEFLGKGIKNPANNQQISYLEVDQFQTGKNNLQGGMISTKDYPKLKGTGFREEVGQIEHNSKGVFGLVFQDDQKGQIISMGININFDSNADYDKQGTLYMAIGNIVYGLPEAKKYCDKHGFNNDNLNLRIVECGIYQFNQNDFVLENDNLYAFYPNKEKDEEYQMRKILAEQERQRIEMERIAEEERKKQEEEMQKLEEERLQKEEEERQRQEELEMQKQKKKQLKQNRIQKGEDITDSSEDYDSQEEKDTFDVKPVNTKQQVLQKQQTMSQINQENTSKVKQEIQDDDATELPTFALMMKKSTQIEQEKLNLEEISEEYEINEDNLQVLYEIGKGAFGEVTVVIDSSTKQRYARKVFANVDDYLEERDLMKQVEKNIGDEFPDIGCGLRKYDNKNKTIYYDIGSCSLNDLMQLRRKYKVYWFEREPEIVFILKEVIRMFKVLFSKNGYHTDLKPANLVLMPYQSQSEKLDYYMKLIDFGSISFDFKAITALTREYYYPNIENYLPIESADKREKFELYTLGRTIQTIMLSSIWEKENAKERLYFENSIEGVEESMAKLEFYYNKDLVTVVQGLLTLENLPDIEDKLNALSSSKINDKENLISRIIALKKEEALQSQNNGSTTNIYENLQQHWDNLIIDTGLQLIDKMDKLEVNKDLRLVNWKIKFMKKIGMFSKCQTYVKEVNNDYLTQDLEKYYKENEDLVTKWAYFEFKLYFSWTKSISYGRFESMDEICKEIVEHFGEESFQHAFTQFWYGWLYLGDQKFDKSIEHLTKSEEIYLKLQPDGKNLDLAEVYRYLGQDYYKKSDADKSLEIYTKEADIRKELQGENSGEYAVVLNSIASIYGHLKHDLNKGLEKIEECIKIYYNSIGEKNQNCVIALDWKAWYLNQLNRKEEAMELWEYAMVKAYQVFGETYHVFKTMLNSHLWNIYSDLHINKPKRLLDKFITKSQQLYSIEDYQESYDYLLVGEIFLNKIVTIYGQSFLTQNVKKQLDYRIQLVTFKLNQKDAINNMKSLELQNQILAVCDIEQVEEYFTAISKKCDLLDNLNKSEEALKTLKQYLIKLKQKYKDIEKEKKDIIQQYIQEDQKQEFDQIEEDLEEEYKDDNEEEEQKYLGDQQKVFQNEEEAIQEFLNQAGEKNEQVADKEESKQDNQEEQENNNNIQKQNSQIYQDNTTEILKDQTERFNDEKTDKLPTDNKKQIKNIMNQLKSDQQILQQKKENEFSNAYTYTLEKNKELEKQSKLQLSQLSKLYDNQYVNKLRNKLLRLKTKNSLSNLYSSLDETQLKEAEKLRIQNIDLLFSKQSQAFFNVYVKLYDSAFSQSLYEESLYYISTALKYTDNKALINQGQARLLKSLELKKSLIQQRKEQFIKDIKENNTFEFDKDQGKIEGQQIFKIQKDIAQISMYGAAIYSSIVMSQVDDSEHILLQVAYTQQTLDLKKPTTFAFQIHQGQHYFGGIGICQVQKIQKRQNIIRQKIAARAGHGLYMITPNGFALNSMDQTQNFQNIVPFHYGRSDIIICEFNPLEKKLTFTKKLSKKTFTLNTPFDKSKDYAIAVGFGSNLNDQVQLITQLDKIQLYDENREELYSIVEQQLQIMANQVGENTLKFFQLRKEIMTLYFYSGLLKESLEKCNECLKHVQYLTQQYSIFKDFQYEQQLIEFKQVIQRRLDNF